MNYRTFLLSVFALVTAGALSAASIAEIDALIIGLRSPQAKVRMQTADRIQQMEQIPDEVIPELFDLLLKRYKSDDPREEIIGLTAVHFADLALAKFGKRAVPRLRELMRDTKTRWPAVGTLRRIGPDAGDAVPELIIALGDRNENVRSLALATLNLLEPAQMAPAVDALIPILRDRKESLQEYAIKALGKIGAPAATAIPELKKLRKRKYSLAETYATEAIDKIESALKNRTVVKPE